MNIFVLSKNPVVCASYHCDKHCVKMILESAQMLNLAHGKGKGFLNHPCSKWARESKENYLWLSNLMFNLCLEYTKRYGREHKYFELSKWFLKNVPGLPEKGLTPFAQAITEECKNKNAVKAYRNYYINEKCHIAKWNHSEKPYWFKAKDI